MLLVAWSAATMRATATQTTVARRGRAGGAGSPPEERPCSPPDPARSATPLSTRLALHALVGPRDRLEPRHRDAITADLAVAVAAVVHAQQRLRDVVDGLARRCREREIAFSF